MRTFKAKLTFHAFLALFLASPLFLPVHFQRHVTIITQPHPSPKPHPFLNCDLNDQLRVRDLRLKLVCLLDMVISVCAKLGGTVVVFVTGLLCLVAGGAPGDEDPICLGEELNGILPPVYPPNSRVLLDSYHYFNLLPPQDGPVWQEVDLDDNNPDGTRTSVSQCLFLQILYSKQHLLCSGLSHLVVLHVEGE